MKTKIRFAVIIAVAVLVGGIIFATVTHQQVAANSSAAHSFTIDVPMERARKIFVRTNAVKKIVAMADAKLVDQKWLDFDLSDDKPLLKRLRDRDWDVKGQGKLTVEMNDSYLGKHELVLNQSVSIEPQRLESKSELAVPSGPIQAYRTEMLLTADEEGQAYFETSLDLSVTTNANAFTKGTVQKSIQSSAAKALKQQEAIIREIIAEYDDELLILPKK